MGNGNVQDDSIISELLNAKELKEKGLKDRGGRNKRRQEQRGTERNRVELEHWDENSRTEAQSPLQHRTRWQPEASPRVSTATQTSQLGATAQASPASTGAFALLDRTA